MNADLIERLRDRLEGVTDGPWSCGVGAKGELFLVRQFSSYDYERVSGEFPVDADAEFLAQCSPDNIRTLLDAIAAKDTALSEAKGALAEAEMRDATWREETKAAEAALSEMRKELETARKALVAEQALSALQLKMLSEAYLEIDAYRAAARAAFPG